MNAAAGQTAHAALRRIFDTFAQTDTLAYRHIEGDLSFRALHASATELAARLTRQGRGPVVILGHKNARFLTAYWAALLSGRTAVPVETGTTPERVAQIIRISGAKLALLAEPEARAPEALTLPVWPVHLETCGLGRVRMDYCVLGTDTALPQDVADTHPAYVLFSSGTTGQPKGIAVSYANLADFVDWAGVLLSQMDPAQCISGNVRYCFDVSLFEMWFSWLTHRPISALDHRDLFNTGHLIDRYAQHKLSTWVSTPALALHWTRDRRFNADTLPDLHTMLFCGEVLSKSLVETLWQRFPDLRIINTYGPTECTVAVTSIQITRDHLTDPRPLPIGRTRARTTLCGAPGTKGAAEMVIRGASVGPGYLGDPIKQARAFPAPTTYMTGDWGQADNDVWYFEGRKDREIKLNGHRIDLNTVEAALREIHGIDDAVADVHPAGRGLRAFLLGPKGAAQLQAAGDRLSEALASYMVPRFWFGTDIYDLNANSKLDRKKFVAALAQDRPEIYRGPVAAQKAASKVGIAAE